MMIVFTVNLEYGFFMNNSKIITSQTTSNHSSDFFKSLEDKYLAKSQNIQNPKSKPKKPANKLNKSIAKSIQQKSQQKEKKKGKQAMSREEVYLDISSREDEEQLKDALHEYNVVVLSDKKQLLSESVMNCIRNRQCVWMNIEIQNLFFEKEKTTKTNALRQYCQNLIKSLNKAAVSIYSRAKNCENFSLSNLTQNSLLSSTANDIYDMLSIRKEVKQDPKTLVKTNITFNAKSHLIVKKLIDFANEREVMMEKQFVVNEVVVRIMPHKNIQNQENQTGHQFQPLIEIRVKDPCDCDRNSSCPCRNLSMTGNFNDGLLMEGMKTNLKVYKIEREPSMQEILERLQGFKKPPRQQTQEQLVEKIKMLQEELMNNKKELEKYKEKVKSVPTEGEVESQMIEDEDDPNDLVLPSERVNVNMCLYNRASLLGSKKGSHEEDIFDRIQ